MRGAWVRATRSSSQGLPAGSQVNDDAAAGINKALNVSGEDPTNADVVGGALTAGKPAVPWAVFRQEEAAGAKDQVFSRSFAGGVWTTRGNGTVGGRSSAAPKFRGSLNFDQAQDGDAVAWSDVAARYGVIGGAHHVTGEQRDVVRETLGDRP